MDREMEIKQDNFLKITLGLQFLLLKKLKLILKIRLMLT